MSKSCIYSVRAMYLGSEPMGELLEGENGSDVIQVPLKRTILRTNGVGKEVELSMSNDSLLVKFVNSPDGNRLVLPIDMLAYCGALRQLASDKIRNREFETLDKSPPDSSKLDPPLFVTIFRSLDSENTLYCHSFVIGKDEEAMELVKLVMEIYYNLIRLQELEENNFSNSAQNEMNSYNKNKSENENIVYNSSSNLKSNKAKSPDFKKSSQSENDSFYMNNSCLNSSIDDIKSSNITTTNELIDSIKNMENLSLNKVESSADYINKLLEEIKKNDQNALTTYNKSKTDVISANDIIKNSIEQDYQMLNNKTGNDKSNDHSNDQNSLECEKYNGAPLNNDSNPIVIRKENNQNIVYKQNVFIRWLQPPTPPPPAPIIIREVQEPAPDALPPLVIYKQAPRAKTPPPLIIRERPPTPLSLDNNEPLVIERRIMAPDRPRKVIIEHLPAPPPKPRDIILEKWLPKEAQQRQVYIQKGSSKQHHHHHRQHEYSPQHHQRQHKYSSKQIYEDFEEHDHRDRRGMYELMDKSSSHSQHSKQIKNPIRRSNSNELVICPQKAYSPHSSTKMIQPYQPNQQQNKQESSYCTPQPLRKPKVAGYRIIRQIIPGPHSTQADIERALSRGSSQCSPYTKASQQQLVSNQTHQAYTPDITPTPQKLYSPHNFYCNHRGQAIYRAHNNAENNISMHRSSSIENF